MTEDISIKQQIRVFGETVSVRGLAKVFKSPVLILKIFWLGAVVISLGLLLWQLSSVFIKYFSYQMTSTYAEGSAANLMPDITICNINSMTDNISSQLSWKKYLELTGQQKMRFSIDTVNQLFPGWVVDNSTYNQIWSVLQTPAGYYYNFPMLDDSETSKHTVIVDCYYMYWDWTPYTDVDCLQHIAVFWDPNYYKCYTIHLPENSQKQIKGVSVIMYLNNFPQVINNGIGMDMRHSSGTGVRAVVHEPGTKPFIKTGISISPGEEATVYVTPTDRTRLPLPYGENDCTTQDYLPFSNEELYDYDACFEVCLQNDVVKSCDCVYGTLSFTQTQLEQVNFEVCQNQSFLTNNDSISSQRIEQMICANVINLSYDACNKMCPPPCDEIYYDVNVNSAKWPHISQHLAFYSKYIQSKENIYGRSFSLAYDPILLEYGSKTDQEMLQLLKNVNLIEDNFVKMNVILDSYNPYVLRDTPAMTWEALLSSIGGCLSLWLGVTVMTFVEVVEFVYMIATKIFKRRKIKSRINDVVANSGGPMVSSSSVFAAKGSNLSVKSLE